MAQERGEGGGVLGMAQEGPGVLTLHRSGKGAKGTAQEGGA